MSDTLYLQLDQNIEVTNPHVYLQDIAALSMSDPKILNRLRVMPVMVLDETKPGRYHLPHQFRHRKAFPVCKNLFCMPGFLFRRRFFYYDF